MKVHLKIGVAITPIILLSVGVLGYWAARKVIDSAEESSYQHMSTIRDCFFNDKVGEFHDILVKNRLDEEPSFVKSYQDRSMAAARGMELPESGFLLALDRDGKFVFSGKKMKPGMAETLLGEKAFHIARGAEGDSTGHIRDSETGWLYSARYFKPWEWVLFYIDSDAVMREAQQSILAATVLIGAACVVATLLFIHLVLYEFFVKPVKKLREATDVIARGRALTTIPIHSRDEFGELSRAVESMANAIQEHRDSQNAWQARLEKTVREKTEHLEVEIVQRKKMGESLKTAKEAAEAANRAKSVFLANMSHELRTPLNAVLGFSQLLSHGPNLTDDQRKNLGTIQRGGEHLLALINQVLDLSKIEAGRATLDETDFDLHRMLDETEEMFRPRVESKGLALMFERAPDAPRYLRTDPVKLRQVLINLLGNAVKFTETGGITVSTTITTEMAAAMKTVLEFTVSDTGPGIAPDEMPTLFRAFAQTETGRTSREGTGLGLAISRKFVDLMGGRIRVESTPGRGTSFTFCIRASESDGARVETAEPARRAVALEPNQPRYRVLVVDDKEDNRRLLAQILAPFQFELREAGNGRAAVETWDAWRPHLIWMDIRMPVMGGAEAARRIREAAAGASRPADVDPVIIALTASAFEEERVAIMAAGCDDFLRKPFRESELFELMTRRLGVRFVYENRAEDAPTPGGGAVGEVFTAERLNALPRDWIADLRSASLRTDLASAKRIIGKIRKKDEALADALAREVGKYRFDIIQGLLGEG